MEPASASVPGSAQKHAKRVLRIALGVFGAIAGYIAGLIIVFCLGLHEKLHVQGPSLILAAIASAYGVFGSSVIAARAHAHRLPIIVLVAVSVAAVSVYGLIRMIY